jgi:hypothetical protein
MARYYASITGMLPPGARSDFLRRVVSTDTAARAGGLFFALGLAAFGFAGLRWASVGFGDLTDIETPRMVIAGLSVMVIGVQMVFQAFMIGILNIPLTRR